MTQQLQRLSTNTAVSTIVEAVQSKSPIVAYVRKDESLRKEFLKAAYVECLKFLMLMDCEDDKAKMLAEVFANDLLEKRDTWKIEDVGMFFKTVRQNQDNPDYKIMGNKITILKLNEWAGAYEGDRSEALVQVHKALPESKPEISERGKEFAQQMIDRINGKKEKKEDPIAEIKGRETENALKLAELWDKVQKGQMSEKQYLVEYNQFLQR